MEISLCDISGIKTKAPCEAALMSEHHVRVEISDFVMRTFILNSALFFFQQVFQVTGTNRVSCAATAQIRKGLQFQGASTSEKSLVPRSFEKLRERKEACR